MHSIEMIPIVENFKINQRIDFYKSRVKKFGRRTSGTLEISAILAKIPKYRKYPFDDFDVRIGSNGSASLEICSLSVFKQNHYF